MHVCRLVDVSLATVRLQARYAQRAWESLIVVLKSGRRRLKVQSLVLLVHAFILMGFITGARLYLLRACEIIEKANLQFLPSCGNPAEYSEQVREDASVLSQAIYLENYFYVAFGGPAPVMTARIEREFQVEFQVRTVP